MSRCFNPRTIKLPDGSFQVVRCEKCLSCLEHRQAGWITRLSQEFDRSPDGVYFVTLTYDDAFLPVVKLDGVDHPVISSEHITKLNADLRKRFQQGFFTDDTLQRVGFSDKRSRIDLPPGVHYKYYITSEYGPNGSRRPHYHGFFSGLPADEELVFDLFNAVWGKGFITCEKGRSEACAAYVSKYLVNHSLVPVDPRLPKPRAWMSKGLGETYLDKSRVVEWHRSAPKEHQFVSNGERRFILPRYYRDRIYDDEMKAVILDDCVRRDSADRYRFSCLSPYEQVRELEQRRHDQEEAVRQAEWHFRKNNKIK